VDMNCVSITAEGWESEKRGGLGAGNLGNLS
jgi:hypothetical protein